MELTGEVGSTPAFGANKIHAMLRNKKQNSTLHALLGKLNVDKEQKEELVYKHTKGRTSSSSAMLVHECQALINELQVIANKIPKSTEDQKKDRQRKKMFSIARELGWTKDGKVEVKRLYEWVEKYGYLHPKHLNDYTLQELPKLLTQFEYVLRSKVHASR